MARAPCFLKLLHTVGPMTSRRASCTSGNVANMTTYRRVRDDCAGCATSRQASDSSTGLDATRTLAAHVEARERLPRGRKVELRASILERLAAHCVRASSGGLHVAYRNSPACSQAAQRRLA